MMMIMIISLMTLLISWIMLFLWILISKKNNLNQEKSSPFECGFDPLTMSRLPFSIHFFLVSMIFLIFDIEIALLIPLVYLMNKFSLITVFSTLFFLMILLLGLYIEYMEKSIEWKK